MLVGVRFERSLTIVGAVCRLAAFDNVRQVQMASLLVHRPPSVKDYRTPETRSK